MKPSLCLTGSAASTTCSSTSGQHLFSAVFQDEYGYKTESFHLGEEYCSIDITAPLLSPEEQLGAEKRANELILEDLPVSTYTLQPEEFDSVPLRKVPDLPGPLRIVEIQGFDYSPAQGRMWKGQVRLGCSSCSKPRSTRA